MKGSPVPNCKNWILLSVTFLYVGRIKKASGTFGTLAALPMAALMAWGLSPAVYCMLSFALIIYAIWVSELYERQQDEEAHDASEIVIDEVVGFLVAVALLPLQWNYWLMAFLLFRTLDILKPPPISWFDRKVPGGLGVVLDDVVAGMLTNALLHFALYQRWI